ncbi:MAG: hypothetical protein QN171_06805, partial [Armatimonadota bacterium]|nr:hypothetical protein [Armatimonadota bacterium]
THRLGGGGPQRRVGDAGPLGAFYRRKQWQIGPHKAVVALARKAPAGGGAGVELSGPWRLRVPFCAWGRR